MLGYHVTGHIPFGVWLPYMRVLLFVLPKGMFLRTMVMYVRVLVPGR